MLVHIISFHRFLNFIFYPILMSELDRLKVDVKHLYDLSKESDKLISEINLLKVSIMNTMIHHRIHAKFDFTDKKIFLATAHNHHISKKLLKDLLKRHYPEIDSVQFLKFLDQSMNACKSHQYVSILNKRTGTDDHVI